MRVFVPGPVTEPVVEPVSLAQAQAWCKVDSNRDAEDVARWITAGRIKFERDTGLSLVVRPWILTMSSFTDEISLDRAPLVAPPEIKYFPAGGGPQATVAPAVYYAPAGRIPAVILRQPEQQWPQVANRLDAVQITFTAGAVDALILLALKWAIKHAYDQENDAIIGNITNELPQGYHSLVQRYRVGGVIA